MARIDQDSVKRNLREEARQKRDALDAAQRAAEDRAIAAAVAGCRAFADAPAVLTYYSIGSEVDTHGLIDRALQAGKVVALPRCQRGNRTMGWHAIATTTDLVPGFGGLLEPRDDASTLIHPHELGPAALALVPGLVFDRHGYRLGYGGGYYDRFLSRFSGISLGLARASQMVESLDAMGAIGTFDRPVQLIATENGVGPAL